MIADVIPKWRKGEWQPLLIFFKSNTEGHTWVKFEVNWNNVSGDIKVQRSEGLLAHAPPPLL